MFPSRLTPPQCSSSQPSHLLRTLFYQYFPELSSIPSPFTLCPSHPLSSMRVTLKSKRGLPPSLPFEIVSEALFSTSTHNFHSPSSIFTLCILTSVPRHRWLTGLSPRSPVALDIRKPEPLLSSHPQRTSCCFRPCGSPLYESLAPFLPSAENRFLKVTPPLKVSCCSSPTFFGCQCPLNLCPQIPSQTTHSQPWMSPRQQINLD